jgi:hypothetical protein
VHYSNEAHHDLIDKVLYPYFLNEKKFRFSGRLDILSKTAIWELKCTSKITQEHQMQVVIYSWLWRTIYPESPRDTYIFNMRTGEKQRLEGNYEQLTNIVVSLLKNKYEEPEILDDEEFLIVCKNIMNQYYDPE